MYVIVRDGERILLQFREGTSYKDAQWGPPCGKVEPNETYLEAAIRELSEETGLVVADGLVFRHVVERHSDDGPAWVGVFFEVDLPVGATPAINEPERCSELGWFEESDLPSPTIDYVVAALDKLRSGSHFSVWRDREV